MNTNAMDINPLCGEVPMSVPHVMKDHLEVTILWQETVQEVMEIEPDKKGEARFFIGEDSECQFLVPAEAVGDKSRFELAFLKEGVLTASYLGNMSLEVVDAGGIGKERPPTIDTGPTSTAPGLEFVSPNDTAVIALGPWTFKVCQVEKQNKIVTPVRWSKRRSAFFGFSALLHAAALFICYLSPPAAAGMSFDPSEGNSRFLKVMLAAPEVTAEVPPDTTPPEEPGVVEPGGKAHAGVSGQMGDRSAEKTRNRSAIKGFKENVDIFMKKDMVKEMARTAGILSYLSAEKMPTSPFGEDRASGFDPENALGALTGDNIGPNFGFGGLGLFGTGRGGGGDGEGTIGVGSLGRISWTLGRGNGRNARDLSALGRFKGRRPSGPTVTGKAAMVKGSLSKETIRRIVRKHRNEVRYCYEQGLQKRPDLEGRVAIKFIISMSGAVMRAEVYDTTVSDPTVASCIAGTVSRMTFPMPADGGIVVVTYPFTLTSSEG